MEEDRIEKQKKPSPPAHSSGIQRFPLITDHLGREIVTTPEGFSGLKGEWEALIKTCRDTYVFQTFIWNFTCWRFFEGKFELALVCVRENGRLVGIGPFMRKNIFGVPHIEPIGGMRHLYFRVISEDLREDVVQAVALEIADAFPRGLIHIPYYAAGEPSIDVFNATLSIHGWKGARWTRNISHYLFWPDNYETYLAQKSTKARKNLLYERKRLEKDVAVKIERLNGAIKDPNLLLDRIGDIQRRSWLSRRGQQALDKGFMAEMLKTLLPVGLCEVFILSRNGKDIAFILNLKSSGPVACLFIGFDEAYKFFSPGKILMAEGIRETLDRGAAIYDFLYGDGEYKRFWANRTKLIKRCVSWKGVGGWLIAFALHRLHGMLARSDLARKVLSRIRRLRVRFIRNKGDKSQ